MSVDVILGLQWGDEGKGKIVDFCANDYDLICRFQGGPNAGHTLKLDGKKYVLHIVPSGIYRKDKINLVGSGVVIDPIILKKELDQISQTGIDVKKRLRICKRAHLITPTHRMLDAASETKKGKDKIGSTLKGIGPTYMDKTGRNGLRFGDIESPDFRKKYKKLKEKHFDLLSHFPDIDFDHAAEEKKWFESIEYLKTIETVDSPYYVNKFLKEGKKVLAEGAQGSMLDIDFGTYPFVTSSNTITAGVCSGLGIAPSQIGEVIGITKAYSTRVGSGPFPTELFDADGDFLRKSGAEFGATTGRPRRCGWIDLPQLKFTCMVNGVTTLCMTKVDVLNEMDRIRACVSYKTNGGITDELPYDVSNAKIEPVYKDFPGWDEGITPDTGWSELDTNMETYIKFIENYLGLELKLLSFGPERESLMVR